MDSLTDCSNSWCCTRNHFLHCPRIYLPGGDHDTSFFNLIDGHRCCRGTYGGVGSRALTGPVNLNLQRFKQQHHFHLQSVDSLADSSPDFPWNPASSLAACALCSSTGAAIKLWFFWIIFAIGRGTFCPDYLTQRVLQRSPVDAVRQSSLTRILQPIQWIQHGFIGVGSQQIFLALIFSIFSTCFPVWQRRGHPPDNWTTRSNQVEADILIFLICAIVI